MKQRIGIVLGNTGSPSAPEPDAVQSYLERFLMDRRIRPMPAIPWWFILHCAILPKRRLASAQRYQRVWTDAGSPLDVLQGALAHKLEASYRAEASHVDADVVVRCAMSYGTPSMRSALFELQQAGCTRIVLVPLYPQSGYTITGSVDDAFDAALDDMDWHPLVEAVDNYHDDTVYLDAICASIRDAGFDAHRGDRVLLSYHSVPLKDEGTHDSYCHQVRATSEAIAARLGIPVSDDRTAPAAASSFLSIGYQCVFGNHPEQWAGPLSQDILRDWKRDITAKSMPHAARVFLACPGFAVDCLETLDDIPQELAPIIDGQREQDAASTAVPRLVSVPCLNDSDAHVETLRHVLAAFLDAD